MTTKEIFNDISERGFVPVIYELYKGKFSFSMPFSERLCNMKIEEFDFSVRARNCLLRTGMRTFGDLVNYLQEKELSVVRNLGKKTIAEIHTRVFVIGYDFLSEKQRLAFLEDLLERNKNN